jgi:hypothetical protein
MAAQMRTGRGNLVGQVPLTPRATRMVSRVRHSVRVWAPGLGR